MPRGHEHSLSLPPTCALSRRVGRSVRPSLGLRVFSSQGPESRRAVTGATEQTSTSIASTQTSTPSHPPSSQLAVPSSTKSSSSANSQQPTRRSSLASSSEAPQ
ncbi:hypothetical protein PM082_013212 [Marasmius tenuissimus]|nr:hypothetical protein PM082_013212 [Marasmius tenuissimus]